MHEETGCDIELIDILGAFGGPEFRVTYRNGDEVAYVMIVYRARITHGVPSPNGNETLEMRFVSPRDLTELDTAEWLPDVLKVVAG